MKLNIKNTNQITPEDQNFVWFPFIPKNDVTMIVGSGGVGKTFFGIDILGKISKVDAEQAEATDRRIAPYCFWKNIRI